jgi:hypothetical protein
MNFKFRASPEALDNGATRARTRRANGSEQRQARNEERHAHNTAGVYAWRSACHRYDAAVTNGADERVLGELAATREQCAEAFFASNLGSP